MELEKKKNKLAVKILSIISAVFIVPYDIGWIVENIQYYIGKCSEPGDYMESILCYIFEILSVLLFILFIQYLYKNNKASIVIPITLILLLFNTAFEYCYSFGDNYMISESSFLAASIVEIISFINGKHNKVFKIISALLFGIPILKFLTSYLKYLIKYPEYYIDCILYIGIAIGFMGIVLMIYAACGRFNNKKLVIVSTVFLGIYFICEMFGIVCTCVDFIIPLLSLACFFAAIILYALKNTLPLSDRKFSNNPEFALKQLSDMLSVGEITEEEYNEKRKEIINNL